MSNVWSEYVANGEAFGAENFVIGAGGLLAHIQLFNPLASGKRIRLRSLNATLGTAIGINFRRHDVALATLGVPAGFIIENLLSSGGNPLLAEMRSESPVAALGTVGWQLSANANTPAIFPPEGREWGFDLLEGQGVLLQAAAGVTEIINWQWAEVAV